MSLKTKRQLHGRQWRRLPMPDEIIDRVHQLARDEGQPEMLDGPVF